MQILTYANRSKDMKVLVYEWDHHRQRYVTPGDRVECLKERVVSADDYVAEVERLRAALESIAANTCCDKCQEAALVARAALSPGDGK